MVVIVTFLLVVFRDLTEGIIVGFALGGLVFIRRMSEATEVQAHHSDDDDLTRQGDDVIVYRMRGAYFFGAAALLGSVLNRIAENPKAFVLDFSEVPLIDSSGARSVALLAYDQRANLPRTSTCTKFGPIPIPMSHPN